MQTIFAEPDGVSHHQQDEGFFIISEASQLEYPKLRIVIRPLRQGGYFDQILTNDVMPSDNA